MQNPFPAKFTKTPGSAGVGPQIAEDFA